MSTSHDSCSAIGRRDSAKSISLGWTSFSKKLVFVLAKLEKDQYLIICAQSCNRYVQFACQGDEGWRVEVTSNHFLKGKDRLNRRQTSWLRTNGWNAPTGDLKKATPEKDPSGSPNFFIDLPPSVGAGDIANLAVEALARGLEIPNPASLAYEAFVRDGRSLQFEELGLRPANLQGTSLMEKVLVVFRDVTVIADLELDKDGDVSIYHGELLLCATPLENKVRLCSALITDVLGTPALLHRLNELNLGLHGSRCVFQNGRIFVSFDILADPFVSEHLATGLKEFTGTAETLASLLRDEFSTQDPVETAGTRNPTLHPVVIRRFA
jgi:hypothetical protein